MKDQGSPKHVPATPETSAALTALAERIDRLESSWKVANRVFPELASRALSDLAIPHARFILMFAGVGITVSVDHLNTWGMIIRGGTVPIYAHMTLLRAALEGALIGRSLVDPRASPMTRVAQGVSAQLDDYNERRMFEEAINAPPRPAGAGKSGADRKADLIAARDRDGILAVPFRGPTYLAARFGVPGYRDSSWLYRMVSATAHAKQWALMTTDLGLSADSPTEGVKYGSVTASEGIVLGTSRMVLDHVETAVAEYREYLGPPSAVPTAGGS